MEVCVDASVAVKWALAGESLRAEAIALLHDSVASGTRLIAPYLFTAEVDSVIRKHAYSGLLQPAQAVAAYRLLDTAPVDTFDHPDLRLRARAIAEQFNQRYVYDSLYAALAELHGCDFWTANAEYYKAVHIALPFVHFLGDKIAT